MNISISRCTGATGVPSLVLLPPTLDLLLNMRAIANFILGWLLILLCYFAGEALVATSQIPVPGALLGLFLLLLVMRLVPRTRRLTSSSAQPLLRHMAVLFVPAVLTVALHWQIVQQYWLALLLALVATTALSLGLVGWLATRALSSPEAKQEHG